MAGFEPALQGLEGPRAAVTPHSLWFGPRASNLHLQAEHGPVSLTGPSTARQLSKTPLLRAASRLDQPRRHSLPAT